MIIKTLESTRIKETMPVSVQPFQKIHLENSQNRAQGESCSIHTYDLTREMKGRLGQPEQQKAGVKGSWFPSCHSRTKRCDI